MPTLTRKLRWRLKRSSVLWSTTLVSLALLKYSWPIVINITDPSTLDIQKCPGCFGEDLCPQFLKGTVTLTNWTRFTLLNKLMNAKNVLLANYGSSAIILKKLAHNSELSEFDNSVNSLAQSASSNVGRNIRLLTELGSTKTGSIDYQYLKELLPSRVETFACTKSQHMIDFLLGRATLHHTRPEHFLTIAMINPEPLIAMAFPQAENWPFPRYYGACGRLSAFEYVGPSLGHFLSEAWNKRARLASQVLQMALDWTFFSPIGLYLTDWSLDNFSVGKDFRVMLVDLENIVLVNRTLIEATKAPGWDVEHHSVAFGCEDQTCFSYSLEDLCTHLRSDHNVFGACHGILPNLLHTAPHEIKLKFPLIERLLRECSWPSNPGARIEAAKQLLAILKLI